MSCPSLSSPSSPSSPTYTSPDPFSSHSSPSTLPLPSGIHTVLPLVAACDNAKLPVGPWDAEGCRVKWEGWVREEEVRKREKGAEGKGKGKGGESALDDEEEGEAEGGEREATQEQREAAFDNEFLCPFFLALPPSPPTSISTTTSTTPGSPSHRRASSTLSFTPLPPSPSPLHSTTSRPSPLRPSSSSSHPIGFLRPQIVLALIEDNRTLVNMGCEPVWEFLPTIKVERPSRRPSYGSSGGSRRGSRRGSSNTLIEGEREGNGALKTALEGLRELSTSAAGEERQGPYAVAFAPWVNAEGPQTRSEHMDRVVRGWKMAGKFLDCLGGWRDELYTIYAPPLFPHELAALVSKGGEGIQPRPGSNEAFRMERSACALFGVATFGVHCNAFIEEEGQPLKLWIPRRSATKQTYPSLLDNTVAGGITASQTPLQSILRECAEEASLPPSYVSPRIKQVGVLCYHFRNKGGWLQPEVQWVYDLAMEGPAKSGLGDGEDGQEGGETEQGWVRPRTNAEDGEVESFSLMSVEEVVRRMCEGEFKPNCALVLIDLFIRRGLLTFESDTRYLEVCTRLRRGLGLPGPA